jgi:HEPN domain-containing protein
MKDPRELALGLLNKAKHDLVAARATITTGQAFDMVCFHAQQAAEKSLRALLAWHAVEYPWQSDLEELFEFAKSLVPEIETWNEAIILLTPFAVEARYEAAIEPSLGETRAALQTATGIHTLAIQIIEHPDEN